MVGGFGLPEYRRKAGMEKMPALSTTTFLNCSCLAKKERKERNERKLKPPRNGLPIY